MKRKVVVLVFVALILVSNLIGISVPVKGFSDTNLVGYWNFDEGSGTTAHDSSGNRNNGTVYGAVWVPGKIGSALSFDGADDYVEVLNSPELNPSSITVMAWVNFKGFPDPGQYNGNPNSMIVTKGTNDHINGNYRLCEGRRNPEVFHFGLTENNQFYTVDGTTDIVEGAWYHVAGTYNGSVIRLYVNGALEREAVVNVARTNNTENLQIGALRLPGYEYWTNGTIDEVEIYDRALSEEEILTHMKSPTSVGGIYIPANKVSLLAPYIGLTILLAVAVVTVVYVKKRKRNTQIDS